MARLRTQYREEILPSLRERFAYRNTMQVPLLEKIVVNVGVGDAVQDSKVLQATVDDLTAITGQKPSIRRAKKAISNFKLRQGMAIGAMVTLRRERMYEFLDRLVNFALPQVRDFGGLPVRAFDGRGNYTLGVREQIIFPEIDYDNVDQIRGMDIVICTTAQTDDDARTLLKGFDLPFSG